MRLATSVIVLHASVLLTGCPKASENAQSQSVDKADESHRLCNQVPIIENFDKPIEVTSGSSCGLEGLAEDEDDEDLNEVLDQCGITDLSNRDRETFSTVIHYGYHRLIHAGFGKAIVPLKSTLDLAGTLAQTTLNVGVEVDRDNILGEYRSGNIEPSDLEDIKKRAEELASYFRGPAKAVSVEQNSNFGKVWKGILCTITAAKSMENKRNGTEVISTYDPPFAPNVSPLAIKARYEKELGNYRYFHNIQVTVTKASENSIFQTGQTLVGNVLVEKIPNETEVEIVRYDPNTRSYRRIKRQIKSDVAYRITNRFGTEEQTLALGFHLWTEYYVDTSKKSFSAVIANVGDEEMMHFLRDASENIKIGD